MKDIEEWKDVKGYEGRYEVSSLGRVRSKQRYIPSVNRISPSIIVKTFKERDGGVCVVLANSKSKTATRRIHVLVAEAFVENPHELIWVKHRDGDKTNNCFKNLEWVGFIENIKREKGAFAIYHLICPLSNQIKYVGVTRTKLKKRMQCHLREKRNSKKREWLQGLMDLGLRPIIRTVKVVRSNAEAVKIEKETIESLIKKGIPLLNIVHNIHNGLHLKSKKEGKG